MSERELSSLSQRVLGKAWEHASAAERIVLTRFKAHERVAQAPLPADARSRGERLADAVARFGGSWAFIGLFAVFMLAWALVNVWLLRAHAFDPYPFVFLNLLLSMLAALQAPVIMMSQNRQAARDREMAEHDYAVNLKAELEIMALHEKLDCMRIDRLHALIEAQSQQIERLHAALAAPGPAGPSG